MMTLKCAITSDSMITSKIINNIEDSFGRSGWACLKFFLLSKTNPVRKRLSIMNNSSILGFQYWELLGKSFIQGGLSNQFAFEKIRNLNEIGSFEALFEEEKYTSVEKKYFFKFTYWKTTPKIAKKPNPVLKYPKFKVLNACNVSITMLFICQQTTNGKTCLGSCE